MSRVENHTILVEPELDDLSSVTVEQPRASSIKDSDSLRLCNASPKYNKSDSKGDRLFEMRTEDKKLAIMNGEYCPGMADPVVARSCNRAVILELKHSPIHGSWTSHIFACLEQGPIADVNDNDLSSYRSETSPTKYRECQAAQAIQGETVAKHTRDAFPKRTRSKTAPRARLPTFKHEDKNNNAASSRASGKPLPKKRRHAEMCNISPSTEPNLSSDASIESLAHIAKYDTVCQQFLGTISNAPATSTFTSHAKIKNDAEADPPGHGLQDPELILYQADRPSLSDGSLRSAQYNHVSACTTPKGTVLDPFADSTPPPFEIVNDISPIAYMMTPEKFGSFVNVEMCDKMGEDVSGAAFDHEMSLFRAEKKAAQDQALLKNSDCAEKTDRTPYSNDFAAGFDSFSDPFLRSALAAGSHSRMGLHDQETLLCDYVENPFADPCPYKKDVPSQEHVFGDVSGTESYTALDGTSIEKAFSRPVPDCNKFTDDESSERPQGHRTKEPSFITEECCRSSRTELDDRLTTISEEYDKTGFGADPKSSRNGHSLDPGGSSTGKFPPSKSSMHSVQSGLVRVKSFFTIRSQRKRARAKSEDSDVPDWHAAASSNQLRPEERTDSSVPIKRVSYLPRLVPKNSSKKRFQASCKAGV